MALVARKADLMPGEPTEEPQVPVFYIDRWLANPQERAMLIEMYKSVYGFGDSAWGAPSILKAKIALAFSSRELVMLRQSQGGAGGGGAKSPSRHSKRDEFVQQPRRERVSSAPVRTVDPPTFGPKVDLAGVAAVRREAALDGTPFCEECAKSAPGEAKKKAPESRAEPEKPVTAPAKGVVGEKKVPKPPPEPVKPVIVLAKNAVAVKKKNIAATHQTVILKTDKPFSGKGTFTCASDCVKFFRGTTEIAVGGGVQLDSIGSGITLEIEGVKPSALDGVSLVWKLAPGAEPVVPDADTKKMTAVDATLNLYKKDGATALSADEKSGDGRVVHKQNPGKTFSRAKLTVKCEPADWSGTMTITAIQDNLKLFDKPTQGALVPLPRDIKVGPGLGPFEYWVEGRTTSAAKVDTGFTLTNPLAYAPGQEADRVKMTVVEIELELYTSPPTGGPAKLDAAAKMDPGRLVLIQDAKFKRKRTKLVVIKKPKDAPSKVTLKAAGGAGGINLFAAANENHVSGESAVTLPKAIAPTDITDEAKGMVFWIDGKDFSAAAQETVLQVDADGVDDACDKVALTVVDFRAENGTDPAPYLVPVKNLITEPAKSHERKIKLEHKIGGATYAWTKSSAKFTLADAAKQTVTLIGTADPSASALAEDLEVVFTPTGKTAFPKLVHKIGVVKIEFSKDANYKGGYDKYEDMPFGYTTGTADASVKVDPKYDFVSIEKSTEGKVKVKYEGADAADIFFTAVDSAKAKPKTENPTASPFDLVITGGNINKGETVIEARVESKTGPIVAKLGAAVFLKVTVEAEFYAVRDSLSVPTAVSQHAVTKAQLNGFLNNSYPSAIAELKITACHDEDVNYDTSPQNGILDLLATGASTEETEIMTACNFDLTKQNIVCVKNLQWLFLLGANLTLKKTGTSVITLTSTPKFLTVNGWFYLEDKNGQKTAIVVDSFNEPAKTVTVHPYFALAADQAFTTANQSRILYPLNGLSGNPVWVKDQTGVEPLANVIGHEIGHVKFGFKDICEKANLMYYTAVGGGNWGLRHRKVSVAYDPFGDEEQWNTIPGR
jgi:hypothetical protein